MRPLPALLLACAVALLGALGSGCGGGGVAAGATVKVYVAAPLCQGAQRQLRREADAVEELRVEAACLPPTARGSGTDLAQTGANARRATEDSSAVAFVETTGAGAAFSRTIVEAADIGWIEAGSGEKAMRRVLQALAGGDGSAPRDTVREALDEVP